MGWKIVRDNMDALATENGCPGGFRACAPEMVVPRLRSKLLEEIAEHMEAGDPRELMDLRDALDELVSVLDPDGEYRAKHAVVVRRRGLFARHLEWNPNPRWEG